jgi:hypothetical protein
MIFLTMGYCHDFDPWGIWNSYPVTTNDNLRALSSGYYYERGLGGLSIVQECRERIAGDYTFPAFTITGEFNRIERYEKTNDGFLFYLIGKGFRHNPINGKPEWQENTRIQVKMYFIDENECYFKYIALEDANGFSLSYFPEENTVYKRLRGGK